MYLYYYKRSMAVSNGGQQHGPGGSIEAAGYKQTAAVTAAVGCQHVSSSSHQSTVIIQAVQTSTPSCCSTTLAAEAEYSANRAPKLQWDRALRARSLPRDQLHSAPLVSFTLFTITMCKLLLEGTGESIVHTFRYRYW